MKALTDTGWTMVKKSRCYSNESRVVVFDQSTEQWEVDAFVAIEKKRWPGQGFFATTKPNKVMLSRICDSGD